MIDFNKKYRQVDERPKNIMNVMIGQMGLQYIYMQSFNANTYT